MISEINFSEINNAHLIQNEIKLLFPNNDYLNLNQLALQNTTWCYAYMEENERQILEEDANHLSRTLEKIGCTYIYNATAENLLQQKNFEVLKSSIDINSIQELNNYWHEIPNADSFIFSDYPLKFLILRPVYTENARLYYLGDKSFIKEACQGNWWTTL